MGTPLPHGHNAELELKWRSLRSGQEELQSSEATFMICQSELRHQRETVLQECAALRSEFADEQSETKQRHSDLENCLAEQQQQTESAKAAVHRFKQQPRWRPRRMSQLLRFGSTRGSEASAHLPL